MDTRARHAFGRTYRRDTATTVGALGKQPVFYWDCVNPHFFGVTQVVCRISEPSTVSPYIICLVVEPTPLKNMLVKIGFIFPTFKGWTFPINIWVATNQQYTLRVFFPDSQDGNRHPPPWENYNIFSFFVGDPNCINLHFYRCYWEGATPPKHTSHTKHIQKPTSGSSQDRTLGNWFGCNSLCRDRVINTNSGQQK